VVVFMPPPVDAGEAPINISIIVTNCEALEKSACGTVSKPAVLAVTDWKNEAIIFDPVPIPLNALFDSSRKIKKAPDKIRAAVVRSTTLE